MANTRPNGHQTAANTTPGPEAQPGAVSEFSGARVEWSISGYIAAPKMANKPPRQPFDPTKARSSRPLTRPEARVTIEMATTTNPNQQLGRWTAWLNRSGRTSRDSTEITANTSAAAPHRRLAHRALRSCTGPSVFSVR